MPCSYKQKKSHLAFNLPQIVSFSPFCPAISTKIMKKKNNNKNLVGFTSDKGILKIK